MPRLSPETTTSYRPIDQPSLAGSTGIDAVRTGAFDEVLRRATAPDEPRAEIGAPAEADHAAVTSAPAEADLAARTDPPVASQRQPAIGTEPDDSPDGASLVSVETPADDAEPEEDHLAVADKDDPADAAARSGAEAPGQVQERPAGAAAEIDGEGPLEIDAGPAAEPVRPGGDAPPAVNTAEEMTSVPAPVREPLEGEVTRKRPAAGEPLGQTANGRAGASRSSAGQTVETQQTAGAGPADRLKEMADQVALPATESTRQAHRSFPAQASGDGKRAREGKADRKGQRVQSRPLHERSEETPAGRDAGAGRSARPPSAAAPPIAAAADVVASEVVRGGDGLLPVVEPAPPGEARGPATATESKSVLVPSEMALSETSAPRADAVRPAASATEEAGGWRFVQRVADAFAAMSHRGGVVRLRLYPPELGSLRLEIAVKPGKLSARVSAETASAKSLLVENLPALRERLAALDVTLERFDVEVREDARHGTFERSDDGSPPWQERRRNAGWHRDAVSTEDAAGMNNTWWRPDEVDGRLDIVI